MKKGDIEVTANSFLVDEKNEINGGPGTKWRFGGSAGGASDGMKGVFRTSAINVGRESWRANWTKGILASDIVSLAVWDPEVGGLGWGEGIEIEIPLSGGLSSELGDGKLNGTRVGCEVHVGGVWRDDLCHVKENENATYAIAAGRVVCVCRKEALQVGGQTSTRMMRLLEDAEDDNIMLDIGNAFVRAGVVLLSNNNFDSLHQQLGILIVLGCIYVLYVYVILRSQIMDWKNVKERHTELLKTDFVEKAIRAMRENFVRIQLSHKDSVVGSDLQRLSSGDVFHDFADEGKTTGGLDAFTNRHNMSRESEKQKMMSQNLLKRHSSLSSFDDEDDADILNFLSTREGDGTAKEEMKSDNDKSTVRSADSFAEDAEKQALLAQESKLKRFKSRKMEQFWNGLRKEHELLVVFGRRGSALSKMGMSSRNLLNPTSPPKGGMYAKEAKASTKSPTSTTSSETDGQLLRLAEARIGGGGGNRIGGKNLSKEEKIQELEDYVSSAHRSTVLLTQLLSFLAMAVFFYEENESMFSEDRWLQIRNANASQATYLILENVLEGLVQVLLTVPITFTMVAIFKQLDEAGTARVLFEMRVATDQAKLLHGIVQSNPVDLRRSIHEVEGLLRILNEKASKRKEDVMVVKYTLNLIKTQLKNVRAHQKEQDKNILENKIVKFRSNAKNFSDMSAFKRLKAAHKAETFRRREVEDVLVKLCSLDSLHQALFLKDRRAMNHMKGR